MRAVTSDDESNMLLRFHDGELTADATGLVSVSMSEHPRYENAMEFFGENGALRIDQNGMIDIAKAGEEDWTRIDVSIGKTVPGIPDTGFARGFVEFAPRIISALAAGETVISQAATFYEGVQVQRVLDAAREADSVTKTVFLNRAATTETS